MRHLMAISEAPRKPKLSPEQQNAQLLAMTKSTAKAIALKVQKVIETMRWESELNRWSKDWTDELRNIVRSEHQKAVAAAREEHEYDLEGNPEAKIRDVSFFEAVTDAFSQWWDAKKDTIEWGDAKYRLEDYMDSHPQTEMSDDLSRLQSEKEMLDGIKFFGGFGSPVEMDKTLSYIDRYVDVLRLYPDSGWSYPGAVVIEIITNGIPTILMYSKTIESLT